MVKIFKLINGEMLIGNIKENPNDNIYVLENPMSIGATPKGVGLGPFVPFMKSKQVEIRKEHIFCEGELETEILNAYNEQFGNGLVIPDPSVGSFLDIQ